MKLRESLRGFFEKHEFAWEISMVVLALVYISLLVLTHIGNLSADILIILDRTMVGITIFFALEPPG